MLGRALQRAIRIRTLYIPTRTRNGRPDSRAISKEESELDEKLKELRQQEIQVRKFLREKRESESIKTLARKNSIELDGAATDDDIALLEADLRDPTSQEPDLMGIFNPGIPESISERLGTNSVVLMDHDWSQYLRTLEMKDGLKGLPREDVCKLISMIDFKTKKTAKCVILVDKMLQDARISTPMLTHNLMSGYATLGDTKRVEELAQLVDPTPVVFGHIAKAYFKCKDFDNVTGVIKRMHDVGLQPTKHIYTMALQSLVQHKRIDNAFTLFDNLKYLSTDMQPDAKMYNTMILAASKNHNINKALDLYQEMITRPLNPLEPDQETLNHLIYACARDEKTITKAWDFFLEQRHFGGELSSQSMRALVYLCGETGELALLRKIIGQLCASPLTYPDDFMVNCLFLAYLNYDPNRVSALATAYGPKVRSQLLANVPISNEEFMPPFLPVEELSDEMIIAESRAMIQFFAEKGANLLRVCNMASASMGAPIVYNTLKIVMKRGDLSTFVDLYNKFTIPVLSDIEVLEEDPVDRHAIAIPRDQDTYRLAIRAATKFRNMDFANKVWVERGEWRKSSMFRELPAETRSKYDIGFAREMLTLFCECGDTESALRLVQSSVKQFRWRRVHLQPLLDAASKQEDFDTILAVRGILRRYYNKEAKLTELHEAKTEPYR